MPADQAKTRTTRHIVMVDPRFQYKYSGWLAALAGTLTFAGGLMAHGLHLQLHGEFDLPRAFRDELAQASPALIWTLLGVSLAVAAGTGLAGLVITHRIAGPIYAMTRYLSELASGRYPSLRPIRRGDELRELFGLFQRSVDFLHARDLEEAYKIEEAILKLRAHASSAEATAALDTLDALYRRKRAGAAAAQNQNPAPVHTLPRRAANGEARR
jgi:hypothetical protein